MTLQKAGDGSVDGDVFNALVDDLNASGGSLPEGASQVYRVGPFAVDYLDIEADNATADIFTPTVGDVILGWWTDPDTFETFDGDTIMGQGTAWEANAATRSDDWNNAGGAGSPNAAFSAMGQPAHGGDPFALDGEFNLTNVVHARYAADGSLHRSAVFVCSTAGAVQIANVGAAPLISGHVDLYFLVSR